MQDITHLLLDHLPKTLIVLRGGIQCYHFTFLSHDLGSLPVEDIRICPE